MPYHQLTFAVCVSGEEYAKKIIQSQSDMAAAQQLIFAGTALIYAAWFILSARGGMNNLSPEFLFLTGSPFFLASAGLVDLCRADAKMTFWVKRSQRPKGQ